jgi:tail protein
VVSGDLITADGQMQYGSLLMGTGTAYRLAGLRGWDDLPPLDLADVPRPSADGAWPGSLYAAERSIETDLTIVADTVSYPAAIAALRAATAPSGGEQPLVIRMGGQLLQCGARCTGRVVGADGYALGVERAALKWTASDPRRYTVAPSVATTAPPSTGSGVTWPVTWPITWPAPGVGGTVTVTNFGDWVTPVVLTITGPLTTPAVYRLDTGDVLELNAAMSSSDVAVIDTLAGTVTMNGSSANYLLTDRSAPVTSFLMPPGSTGLAFRAAVTNSAALLTASWRSAYM